MRFIKIFILFFLLNNLLLSQCYWQQKVDYKMDIYLDVNTNILKGNQQIKYYNNSQDTLKELYFHLYWNAFKKGSFMHKKSASVKRVTDKLIEKLSENEEGKVTIKKILIKNKLMKWDEHDTILKLFLEDPLRPKDSLLILIDFESQVPLLVRRAGRDNSQGIRYSMAQWYPKIAEYDAEGWHHDEYAGREFYGVWGNFDVSITLDSKYIVASSGEIQNPNDVGCGYELGKIDTIILNPTSVNLLDTLKTWHFKAENVHDFAWAADDKYIHDITYWNDVTIHSFYTPPYQERWKNVKKYAQVMLDYYSKNFGEYPYKTFTVAQAGDGGMEYPTIIFNLGYSPGLMAHEGGHQWFYGLLGNNESREAWLDEGIITYTTDKTLYEGFNLPKSKEPESGISGLFQLPYDEHNNYRYYWTISKLGIEEPILTHSDIFKDDISYNFGTYVKGSFILPMLEYVIGDSVYKDFMKEYFKIWHFKHPHTSDFQRLAEKMSGMELDWFFDEWLRTTKKCDYSIKSISGKWIEINNQKKYQINCVLQNNDDIVMPIDLLIRFSDGRTQKFNIPIDWNPKQEQDLIILKRWNWVDKEYSFNYIFDNEVTTVEIDPSLRMKDLNRLNNTSGIIPPLDINFIRPIQLSPPIDKYWITYRPNIWYSQIDGFRLGLYEIGGYMGSQLIQPDYYNIISLNYLTKTNQIDYKIYFSIPLKSLGEISYITTSAYKLYGIKGFDIKIDHTLTPLYPSMGITTTVGLYYNYLNLVENDFPFYNVHWDRGAQNKFGFYYLWTKTEEDKSKIKIVCENIFHQKSSFYKFSSEISHSFSEIPISFRLYGGYTSKLPTSQESFYLSSSNPSEQFFDPIYNSIMFLNKDLCDNINLNLSGGGGISSHNKYLITGKNIIAANFDFLSYKPFSNINFFLLKEMEFSTFVNFANVWIDYNNYKTFIKNFYSEAGFSFTFQPFANLGIYSYIIPELKDLIIRLNIPLYIDSKISGEKHFDWRWNISIGRIINL